MGFYFPRIFILDFDVISVVRQMIMSGCAAFAQVVGPTRIEAELLPQWWEQVKKYRIIFMDDTASSFSGKNKGDDPGKPFVKIRVFNYVTYGILLNF